MPGQSLAEISLSAAGIDIFAGGKLERPQFANANDDRFLHADVQLVGFCAGIFLHIHPFSRAERP
jgi:hypothetical protein